VSAGDPVAALGVDIGATTCRVAAFDATDSVLDRGSMPTPRGPDAIAVAVAAMIDAVLDGRPAGDAVVGVGIPGRVDVVDGSVRNALNLGIDGPVPFGADLADRLGCAVHVENDVNAGALGAAALLDVHPPSNLAYLSIGTGLAAGLVLGGRIHRGATGGAGEVGHVPVRADGPRCTCGQVGCAETLGSGAAIRERWGPRGADALWLDVDVVAIGGGVSQLGDRLGHALGERLAADAGASPLLATLDVGGRVRLVPAGDPVGELGAVLAARQARVPAVTVTEPA
jgi:predicted NBD/HSP70 family sugar kinase